MRTVSKVLMIIGVVLSLIGIVGATIGIRDVIEASEDWDNFEIENANNGTITIDDKDGLGDKGITFWVKGEYVDEDENDIWDVCDNTLVTITEKPDYNSSWDWSGLSEGGFYFEVIPFKEGCKVSEENQDYSKDEIGLVKIGRACYACYAGNISFESNQSVWVTYDDKIEEEVLNDLGAVFVSAGLGFTSLCCGVILLIVGVILHFTMKDDGDVYLSQDTMPQIPMVQQSTGPITKTHMSAPVFDDD